MQSTWRGLAAGWQAVLSSRLHGAGVERAAISGELDGELVAALWRAHGGVPSDGVTVSSMAQAMADAVKPLQDIARDRLNAAGARIGDALDYVAHTDPDPRRMRAAAGPRMTADDAFRAWWEAEGRAGRCARSTTSCRAPAKRCRTPGPASPAPSPTRW